MSSYKNNKDGSPLSQQPKVSSNIIFVDAPLEEYVTQEELVEAKTEIQDLLDDKVSYEYQGKVGAKNLLPQFTPNAYTISGITITVNADGSYTFNGTATGYATFVLANDNILKQTFKTGSYILSTKDKISQSGLVIRINDGNRIIVKLAQSTEQNVQFTINSLDDLTSAAYNITVTPNTVCDNLTVYPMIRFASDQDDTWQPYAMTNKELTDIARPLSTVPIIKGIADNSIIENDLVDSRANGIFSHVEGRNNKAYEFASHAEGYLTTASGANGSHAEGWNTTASGRASHSEGYYSAATGEASHAESMSVASGSYSHSQNYHTAALGKSQTAIGEYNIAQGATNRRDDSDYAVIVGNGTDADNRSNALAVQWDGTVVFQDGAQLKTSNDIYKVMGKMGAKNLLKYPYYNTLPHNADGITYSPTTENDGGIIINGTSTAFSLVLFVRSINAYPHGKYIMSVNQALPTGVVFEFGYVTTSETPTFVAKKTLTTNNLQGECVIDSEFDGNYTCLRMSVASNTTVDNFTVYPMFRLAEDTDSTWQPYAMTNKELTENINTQASAIGEYLPISAGSSVKKYSALVGATTATFSVSDFLSKYGVTSDDIALDISAETLSGNVVAYNNVSISNGVITITFDALVEAATFICKCSTI